jgi:hypothetical protein
MDKDKSEQPKGQHSTPIALFLFIGVLTVALLLMIFFSIFR